MTTSNEVVLDSVVSRQIDYIAYSTGIVREASPILRKTEDKLRDLIYSYYGRIEEHPIYSREGRKLIKELDDKIRELRGNAWSAIYSTVRNELQQVAAIEVSSLAATIEGAVPVTLGLSIPTTQTLTAIVISKPFEGKVLKDWINNGGNADINLISGTIKNGLVQGETVTQVVRNILGTAPSKYPKNALVRKTERDMTSIVLTGVSSVSNEAREQLYESNSDVINEVIFVATLDSHTTFECAANDTKVFKLGDSPIPPLHFRCRSAIVPYLNPDNLLTRPYKPTTEKGLLKDFTKANKLDPVKRRDDLPRGYKGKYDAFARAEVRKQIGHVPAKTSFDDFLRRRSKAFQDEYLGPNRAEIYRNNPKMTVSKFTASDGSTLTLKELEARSKN